MYPFIFVVERKGRTVRQEVVYGQDRSSAERNFYEMHDIDLKSDRVYVEPMLQHDRVYS
jgi:hypothetical protein